MKLKYEKQFDTGLRWSIEIRSRFERTEVKKTGEADLTSCLSRKQSWNHIEPG